MNKIKTRFSIRTMLFGLLACSMMSCSDDLDIQIVGIKGEPHDPNQPIVVTDYSPKEGSAGQKMVVYGKNFGTDPSIIKVAVGGAEAIVVSACGDAIYCLLPSKTESDMTPDFLAPEEDDEVVEEAQDNDDAVEGDNADARTLWVAVGPQGSMKTAKAEASFSYVKAWKVRTLAGEVNEKNEIVFLDGPFGNCGNFANAENFCVDPVNPDLVWISGDNSSPGTNVRLLDLKNKTVTTLFKDPSWLPDPKRVRWVDFTTDGEYNMLIAFDSWSADIERPGVALLKRDHSKDGIEAFAEEAKNPFILIRSFFVNGVVAHPKSNSLFFNCYSTTGVYKFPDHTKYPELKGNPKGIYHLMDQGASAYQAQDCQLQYSFGERSWEFVMHMHPTGKYMIGVHVNGTGFLSKAFYNEEDDVFVQPGAFVNSNGTMGLGGSSGYLDGVGLNARIYNPREGCFVYNPDYAGQEDEYDFYFTDSGNHCIRKVTPQGIVSTFAGRGTCNDAANVIGNNSSAKGYADGLARGEAMFNWPRGIAYSESRNSFIIGDCANKRIREIYVE